MATVGLQCLHWSRHSGLESATVANGRPMDSLGDVYLASGDTSAALASAEQTLVLLDRDSLDTTQRKADLRRAAEDKITRPSTR